jgi:phage/plasmid-associated DNA primase
MEVRIATESYKKNNDIIGQFFSEAIDVVEDPNSRLTISKIYGDFRMWTMQNASKGKKLPDRNQIKAYFEKNRGPYPVDGKGWKNLKIKAFSMQEDDEDLEEPIV